MRKSTEVKITFVLYLILALLPSQYQAKSVLERLCFPETICVLSQPILVIWFLIYIFRYDWKPEIKD